jgi:hypothetical protein
MDWTSWLIWGSVCQDFISTSDILQIDATIRSGPERTKPSKREAVQNLTYGQKHAFIGF